METLTHPPQIVAAGDAPRARKSDPNTSQRAADTSAATLRQTKYRVLRVIEVHPDRPGSEINDLYRFMGARLNWSRVAWDTPRKRAGELADDGYLEVVGERPAVGNNQPESIYRLSEKGARVLRLGKGTAA